ncbi:MAG: tetraacyldisaccharide 4'-kinase, partial [Sphingobacteriales bacterium]
MFPFSLIYGLVVIIRNWCYDSGIFKSRRFNKPVICIGNLDVGGAGKTPMTEYLIRLLKNDHQIATLSRGYGRETKGFVEVGGRKSEVESQKSRIKNQESRIKSQYGEVVPGVPGCPTCPGPKDSFGDGTGGMAGKIGDEPSQFKHKFPEITVAVCESRARGIKNLLAGHDIILLDDAFQHRAVSAGLNILLFDYNRLDEPHLLLPAGNLREPFSGRWRAQIIIVTKCPVQLTAEDRERIANKIEPLPYQQLFFTSIVYGRLQGMGGRETDIAIDKETTVFLLTGIASAGPLVRYLNTVSGEIIHHKYPDHHRFT